ncbi:LRR receptor-like serine/threonine-protein kinas e [Populus alba x Populus x berolinensis]|uniref:non-specific serine/threonine protein kinase n=2 Tax=Populus TaxID=3689 RepID=A0A4U5QKK7_POPAL|nr:LRR receptor-like serine/threonine-protein kinas e [Populus alba x Populus x berolinensis]TKS11250.1 putative LRR receptor-like serine/threonine-protein kinas e [Populus alba]
MLSGLLNSLLWFLGILLFINYIEATTATATFGFTNQTDQEALLAIKDLISEDPFNSLSSWNSSLQFCSWQGVTCGRRHRRVTSLNLSSLELAGSLSPHIGNLTFLRVIDLSRNRFHHIFPPEVGQLFRLRYLSLANNSFQGELPSTLGVCSNLVFLNLYGNNFRGKIPSALGSLSRLRWLNLVSNHFTGAIPPSFGNLSSMKYASLALNNLEGIIPAELGRLSALEFLTLYSNKFSGLTLPNLQNLYLGTNQFFGHIPKSIVNLSSLIDIDLAYNSLTGRVPNNLGNLQNLETINFGGNPLGDENTSDLTFLTSLTNCTNLREVWFFENHLRGVLPASVANLSTNLYWLTLGTNYITGDIPVEIENLKNLAYLAFPENMLTGRLPDSIGKLSKLQELHIYTNKISGNIPSSFGNLSGILRLNLADNFLEGTIPVSLANYSQLEGLELSYNQLSGVIPEKLAAIDSLIGLFLALNNLTGPLPSQLGNARNLNELDISENKLSGEIPRSIESCVMLENLNMEGNFFEGTIPSSFKKLRSIRVLNLARNNLSGQIPKFLGELPLLGYLNLSVNSFDGEVPTGGVFNNASAFSVAGNDKLCGGIKALQLHECPKQRQQNGFPRKVVILVSSIALFLFLLLASVCAVIHSKKRNKSGPSLVSPLEKKYQRVSYSELARATGGFSSTNIIGDGKYGTVYQGILGSDDQVAVKVFKLQQRGASNTFMAEINALRNIRHRNLVRIVNSCSTIDFKGDDFKALIMEFMSNGSLESWLHASSAESEDFKNLSLLQRINIATDLALALDYLHNQCETTVVHCDLKPSNILLDNDLTAHVGDFGLAKILLAALGESFSTESSSICIRGTIGYVAPEYGMGGEASTHGDVYSYGILLLEMFTGKRPIDSMFTGEFNLHSFVKAALPDQVMEIIGPLLSNDIQEEAQTRRNGPRGSRSINIGKVKECLASILQVGLRCSTDLPSERMDIGNVPSELHKITKILSNR